MKKKSKVIGIQMHINNFWVGIFLLIYNNVLYTSLVEKERFKQMEADSQDMPSTSSIKQNYEVIYLNFFTLLK